MRFRANGMRLALGRVGRRRIQVRNRSRARAASSVGRGGLLLMRPVLRRVFGIVLPAFAALASYFGSLPEARAVPSFARKYQTSCLTCHTVFPVLNPFGEAFRRNGYRFPSQGGSVDSDAIKANMIPMGQEEYEKTFPDSVWPDKIVEAVPLSVMFNGSLAAN